MCFVRSETETPRFSYINPETDHVEVYTFYVNNTAGIWDDIWIQIGCFGSMSRNLETTLEPDDDETDIDNDT
jgi:hypothetical protein